jgi:hypothetical protein
VIGNSIAWPRPTEQPLALGTVRKPNAVVVNDLPMNTDFADTSVPGLYTLEAGSAADIVAVNLAPEESRTAPLPVDQLEALGIRLGAVETIEDKQRAQDRKRQLQIEELEHTQKLWRWGVLTAITLLMAETWLAGRRTVAPAVEPTE